MNVPEKSVQQLRPTIVYALDHDLLPTAEFSCERLLAQDPANPDSAFLYALTLYKDARYKASYNEAAQHCATHAGCAYIFAKSCLKLGQEPDGITSLTKTMPLWSTLTSDDVRRYEPDAIACYMLLAKLYNEVGDAKRSALNYSQVLKLNPYMFEAFEQLCKLGAKVKVNSIYKPNNPMGDIQNTLFGGAAGAGDSAGSKISGTIGAVTGGSGSGDLDSKTNMFKTPTAKKVVDDAAGGSSPEDFLTPRGRYGSTVGGAGAGMGASFKHTDGFARKKGRSATSSITSRLLHHSLNSLGEPEVLPPSSSPNEEYGTGSGVGFGGAASETSGKRDIHATFADPSTGEPTGTSSSSSDRVLDSLLKNMNNDYLVSIYSKLAKGFRAMCAYDCFKAIRIFDSLPENERNTPWVLSKLGRLHFEIVNYEEAENYFVRLRKLDRTRIEDMEYYSTLLWHLHKEVELSFLSHELYEVDKKSPQAWVAVGNLFSLKREPDEAIKCFQKAIKLDKSFVYAYTLQGHEYLANDAFENAMEQFRNAIVLDHRHYNAFYGIGMVYLKLGDFRKAEFHFRKAAEINPVNVILICCVGMVLEKLDKREQALRQYIFASKLQPLSMLPLFKKAQALFSLKQYDLALKDFEKLEDMAPDEASVHFLLGKLYKFYGRRHDAIKQFTVALNLDPKGSHLIKEALEGLQD